MTSDQHNPEVVKAAERIKELGDLRVWHKTTFTVKEIAAIIEECVFSELTSLRALNAELKNILAKYEQQIGVKHGE